MWKIICFFWTQTLEMTPTYDSFIFFGDPFDTNIPPSGKSTHVRHLGAVDCGDLNIFLWFLCRRFDLLANGGASLTLSFERAPFLTQYRTVWVPWNVFYVMDTLVMKKVSNRDPSLGR